MFKKFFQNRIQKDQAKLEKARKKCIDVLQQKGLSNEEIKLVEGRSFKKAASAYVDHPNIQAALKIYFKTLQEESLKIGYDVA